MKDLRQAAQQALEALENSKRTHYYCEDTWYSCPKHEEGCANESEGDECNCGADEVNVRIESAITALRAALAEPEQEQPVAIVEQLWAIIDDIDTYSDAAKSDDELYRRLVESRQADRWKTGITTDGYSLNIPGCSAPTPRTRSPLPLKDVERLIYEETKINPNVADDRELLGYIVNAVRAIERAHGIKEQEHE